MSVAMHVRCPVIGCRTTINYHQLEAWGIIDPTDHGCIIVTASGDAVGRHMRTHTSEEILEARKQCA